MQFERACKTNGSDIMIKSYSEQRKAFALVFVFE